MMNKPREEKKAKFWRDVTQDNYLTTQRSLEKALEEVSMLKQRLTKNLHDMSKAAEEYRNVRGEQPDCEKCRFSMTMNCQMKEDLSCFKRGPLHENGKDICPDCGGVLDVVVSVTGNASCKRCPFSYSW